MNARRVGDFCRSANLFKVVALAGMLAVISPVTSPQKSDAEEAGDTLRLSRAVRSWEFLPVTGQRAAFFGNEAGRMEAWVYPLKLLRDLHLIFHVDNKSVPADSLARSIEVRPESASILYAGDDFTVRETFFVPVHENGGVILLDVSTEQPLEVEVVFQRDFQMEWPGAIGGTYLETAADGHSFIFGEESKRFAGMIGSPTATELRAEYQTNYSESRESSFGLGITAKERETKIIALAGSTQGYQEAAKTYGKLTASWQELLAQSAKYYRDYLEGTVSVELPDAELQRAYDWARVSMAQGLVVNPELGAGLIAGYRTSGDSQRPGFAWFFGRDALWTSLALNSAGDTATSKTALAFLSKFQREDGKIPHEISQAAGYVDWFKSFPYGYASADATPLYIIAMNDYLKQTGDTAFIQEHWNNIWKAYQFLRSTWDANGFPKNEGVGHGWVEGGPLLPVKTELYQTGLGTEALRGLAELARHAGHDESAEELENLYALQKSKLDQAFWLNDKERYAFAVDHDDRPVDELSVLTTVPMWFGVLDENKANKTITQLAEPEMQTDWGMRIISNTSPKYSGEGYHFGSVWPLFTGWAAVGEYRYHRAQPAYGNLRSNALLSFDGSLGHVTEVLSGSSYEPLSTSSPHQIWSAAMVVSPILRGLLGLEKDELGHTLTFAPHAPVDWTSFTVHHIPLGGGNVDLRYRKTLSDITLEITQSGSQTFVLKFEPALSLRGQVLRMELNGRPTEYHVAANEADEHVLIQVPIKANFSTLHIRIKNDFGVSYAGKLPALGETSEGLRILSETWSAKRDSMKLEMAGLSGASYALAIWNPQQIRTMEGAQLVEVPGKGPVARMEMPRTSPGSYVKETIVLHF